MSALKKIILLLAFSLYVASSVSAQLVLDRDEMVHANSLKRHRLVSGLGAAALSGVASLIATQKFNQDASKCAWLSMAATVLGSAVIPATFDQGPKTFIAKYSDVYGQANGLRLNSLSFLKLQNPQSFLDDMFVGSQYPFHDGATVVQSLLAECNQVSSQVDDLAQAVSKRCVNQLADNCQNKDISLAISPWTEVPGEVESIEDAEQLVLRLRLYVQSIYAGLVRSLKLIQSHKKFTDEINHQELTQKKARAEFERQEEWRLKQASLKAQQDLVAEQIRLRKNEVRTIAREEVDKVTRDEVARKAEIMRLELRNFAQNRIAAELTDIRRQLDRVVQSQKDEKSSAQLATLTSQIRKLERQLKDVSSQNQRPPAYNPNYSQRPPAYNPNASTPEPSAPPFDE